MTVSKNMTFELGIIKTTNYTESLLRMIPETMSLGKATDRLRIPMLHTMIDDKASYAC
jgi:hypothetical protein